MLRDRNPRLPRDRPLVIFASTPSRAGIHEATKFEGISGTEKSFRSHEEFMVMLVPAPCLRRFGICP